jgi:hypothetical protein
MRHRQAGCFEEFFESIKEHLLEEMYLHAEKQEYYLLHKLLLHSFGVLAPVGTGI